LAQVFQNAALEFNSRWGRRRSRMKARAIEHALDAIC
jgi:hypothetical protein